jgi:hypothetical protein
MAFLDNSGDIILDAVLTDTGRLRLAQGDGSFKISKFALGDDEINYELYNKAHSSGSAYFDLEILQTPVLEAFTNNTSNLKTKLVSLSRTNILYMPVLKLNENAVPSNLGQDGFSNRFARKGDVNTGAANKSDNKFYVAVDKFTFDALKSYRTDDATNNNPLEDETANGFLHGVLEGFNSSGPRRDLIRVDQGLDTEEIAPEVGLDSDLRESAYIVEMDYRLGRVKQVTSDTVANVNFIDDDNVASYYLTDNTFVNPKGSSVAPENATGADGTSKHINDLKDDGNPQVYKGPRGTTLQFRIHASQDLASSTYLFNQLGSSQAGNASGNIFGFSTGTTDDLVVNKKIYFIDSIVRVVGANTGYRLDIPVRYVKIAD